MGCCDLAGLLRTGSNPAAVIDKFWGDGDKIEGSRRGFPSEIPVGVSRRGFPSGMVSRRGFPSGILSSAPLGASRHPSALLGTPRRFSALLGRQSSALLGRHSSALLGSPRHSSALRDTPRHSSALLGTPRHSSGAPRFLRERSCSSPPLSRPFLLLVGFALFQGVAP